MMVAHRCHFGFPCYLALATMRSTVAAAESLMCLLCAFIVSVAFVKQTMQKTIVLSTIRPRKNSPADSFRVARKRFPLGVAAIQFESCYPIGYCALEFPRTSLTYFERRPLTCN
jgi:hypothetical protein